MNPRDLIRIARRLASGAVGGNRGRPRQTELCRAVSAVYYALFHSLALSAANTLAGSTPASRSGPAWRRTYRALEHRNAKNQCSNSAAMSQFPPEIQAFEKCSCFSKTNAIMPTTTLLQVFVAPQSCNLSTKPRML